MPRGVGQASSASWRNKVYVCCGQTGARAVDTSNEIQCLTIHDAADVSSFQWHVVAHYNSPVFSPYCEYGMSCAVLEGDDDEAARLVIFGGQTVRVDSLNLETKVWSRIANMSCRRMECGALKLKNVNDEEMLFVAGGYDYSNGYYHNTVEVYRPKLDKLD